MLKSYRKYTSIFTNTLSKIYIVELTNEKNLKCFEKKVLIKLFKLKFLFKSNLVAFFMEASIRERQVTVAF